MKRLGFYFCKAEKRSLESSRYWNICYIILMINNDDKILPRYKKKTGFLATRILDFLLFFLNPEYWNIFRLCTPLCILRHPKLHPTPTHTLDPRSVPAYVFHPFVSQQYDFTLLGILYENCFLVIYI